MRKFCFKFFTVLQAASFMFLFCIMPVSALNISRSRLAAKNDSGIVLMAIFGITAIVSIILFILFGIDKKVKPTDEIKPPDDITPAEAGFILDRNIKPADITSLIIYWANNGYISVNNISEAGTDELQFVKLKNSDADMKQYEILIYEKLFNGQSSVELADIKSNFKIKLNKVNAQLTYSFKSPSTRFFTRTSSIIAIICTLMAGLCTGGMTVITAITHNYYYLFGIINSISVFIITVCLCALLRFFGDKTAYGKKFGTCMVIYIAVLLVIMIFCFSTIPAVISSVSAAVFGIVAALSKKHTKRGKELLGKLIGLKQFIVTAEKDKIDTLVKENPSLFYEVLPFALSLGVAYQWVTKFENIKVQKPSWYKSSNSGIFNSLYFIKLINSCMVISHGNKNSFETGAFAASRGFQSGSRTRHF